MNQINGRRGAYLQPTEYGRDESGLYTLFTWEGTKAECLSNVPAIEASGGLWNMRESPTGAKCTLTARFPQGPAAEVPDNEWELFSQDAEKEFLQSDSAILSHYTPTDIQTLKFYLENTGVVAVAPSYSAGAVANDILFLQEIMQKGFTSTRVIVPTLRKTQQVSTVYQVPNSLENVGRIYTTDGLVHSEPSMRADIAENLADYVSTIPNLEYGWYKKYPTIRSAAKQKTQIVQEWEYGLWPTRPATFGAFITA